MTSEDAGQARITLTKTEKQQHNQTQARCGVLLIFQNQIDASNQAIFDKLNQAIEHAGLTGEVAIQCRFGNADRGGQFCRRDTLASIAGFQHQRQRLKYFLATVPFRSLFFCHVTKYP